MPSLGLHGGGLERSETILLQTGQPSLPPEIAKDHAGMFLAFIVIYCQQASLRHFSKNKFCDTVAVKAD